MTPSPDKIEPLWQRLLAAHRQRPVPEAGAGWQARVMRTVSRLPSPARGPETESLVVGELVWRVAVAAGLAAIVAAGYLADQPSGLDLVASLFFDDPVDGLVELAFNR